MHSEPSGASITPVYEEKGHWFRTPAALGTLPVTTALPMYMLPAVILPWNDACRQANYAFFPSQVQTLCLNNSPHTIVLVWVRFFGIFFQTEKNTIVLAPPFRLYFQPFWGTLGFSPAASARMTSDWKCASNCLPCSGNHAIIRIRTHPTGS